MKHTSDATDFRLSRIYAQGWNASRGLDGADQTNPYPAEPERSRWQSGFASAQTTAIRKAP